MIKNEFAGFERPRQPKDKLTAELYQKYNLGPTPSLESIEPVATPLLESPLTMMEGASLVLGRDVRSEEKDLVRRILFIGDGKDRFGALLLERAAAEMEENRK